MRNNHKTAINEKLVYQLLIVLIALIYLSYIIYLLIVGENARILYHDNLDSELVYLELLKQNHALFDYFKNPVIPQVMDGISRSCFRSGLNVTVLLYSFLTPVYAYLVNYILVHLIGFVGMYLLLTRHFLKDKPMEIILLCSLIFAIIPYYHFNYGISISGQPLLLFCFLNLLNRNIRWYNWLIIVLFPLYSFIVVTLPFFLPILIIIIGFNIYKTRRINYPVILALLLLILSSISVEYQLVRQSLFDHSFISQRDAWNSNILSGNPSFYLSIKKSVYSFFITQYHTGKFTTVPVFLLFLLLVVRNKGKDILTEIYVVSILLFIALWVGFNQWFIFCFKDVFHILRVFNSDRFFFLAPFLWILLLSLVLARRANHYYFTIVKFILTILLVVSIVSNDIELKANISGIIRNDKTNLPTYKAFFAESLFRQIKIYIGQPQNTYKVVCIGFYPSIPQYNGFYTLDSYQNYYPLDYKIKFRKIIERELDKNSFTRSYFDGWGSRTYIFVAEIGSDLYNYIGKKDVSINNLELNTGQLKLMGCKYVFSSMAINNAMDNNLDLLKVFDQPDSIWRIYLYRIR